jgi:hypothetical protein
MIYVKMAVPTLPRYVLLRGEYCTVEGPKLGAARAWASRSNLLGKLPMHATDDRPIAEKKGGFDHVMQIRFAVVLGT